MATRICNDIAGPCLVGQETEMEEDIPRKWSIPGYLHLYIVTLCVLLREHMRATSGTRAAGCHQWYKAYDRKGHIKVKKTGHSKRFRYYRTVYPIDFLRRNFSYAYIHCSFSKISITSPTSQLILQPFPRFTYVTAHSPTLPLLHLRHNSISNPSFASPRHRLFTYVTWRAAHGIKTITNELSNRMKLN